MKTFLKNNLYFFGVIFLPLILITVYSHNYIPAPKITNSYSYNEKMKVIVNRDIEQPQILAIGSSVTFNNLNSNVVVEKFKTNSFLNMSSWGLRINDSYLLTKQLTNTLNPKRVIMMSSAIDFYGSTIVYNTKKLNDYVLDKNIPKYQYKYFDTKYFFKRLITNYINFNTNDIYKSLNYGQYGAVMLNGKDLEINQRRWVAEIGFDYIWPAQYEYLDSLSAYLSDNNIELIFIQSPIRSGMVNELFTQNMHSHKQKVNKILQKNSHKKLIDCTDTLWSDDLFTDSDHLNRKGSIEVSNYWLNKYFGDNPNQ